MAHTTESKAFAAFMESTIRAHVEELQGLRDEPGLSFKVRDLNRGLNRQAFWTGRQYRPLDRPFTKAQHRAHRRRQRKRRFIRAFRGPYYETKRRLVRAWEALRGIEDDSW